MKTAIQDNSNRSLVEAISLVDGYPEIPVTWIKEHLGEFDFVDVRERHELDGPLGEADGVTNVPLARFIESVGTRDKSRPLVIICRSGRRSALAVEAAQAAGIETVAAAEGGMIAWNQYVLGNRDIRATERDVNAENLRDAIYDYNGVPEVSVQWASQNLGRFRLIDVRQDHELVGELGRVLQSEHVVLNELAEKARDWDKDAPYVIMCRSGGRSARGTLALMNMGFTNVASLEGGMSAWAGAGLPIARPN